MCFPYLAFRDLPEEQLEFLTSAEGFPQLVEMLQYHVVLGSYTSDMMEDGMMLTTLQGDSVTLSISDASVLVNTANILTTDILASNGGMLRPCKY